MACATWSSRRCNGTPAPVRTPRWNSRAGQAELSVLAAFEELDKELAQQFGEEEKKSDWHRRLRDRVQSRVALLKEFDERFREHIKAAGRDGEPTEVLDRLWSDRKRWRVDWLARYKGLDRPEAGPGGPELPPAGIAFMARLAQVDRYLATNADLRNALNILRDDRHSIENSGAKLPPIDP